MNDTDFGSWGRFPRVNQKCLPIPWRGHENLKRVGPENNLLPYGLGRSYGDSCLNDGQYVFSTRGLNRFISFDSASGILTCEAGVSFAEILEIFVPRGFFLPVTPGTKFITVGGALANDIHGKNHHRDGSFGNHVIRFELLRSDGTRSLCSPNENAELFSATLGGLGLTGLITWVQFKMLPISSPFIDQETIKFEKLKDFFPLAEESNESFQYTVAWIDCTARGKGLGRGHFIRGNHSKRVEKKRGQRNSKPLIVPFDFPNWALSYQSVKMFNGVYYHRQTKEKKKIEAHFEPFFYPLDGILQWNRIYGRRGFLQYQCVVPMSFGCDVVSEVLDRVASSGLASFLSVLKTFGTVKSLGMMSFPRSGVTLALDFPVTGPKIFGVLGELDKVVTKAGGAIYPAKDARMSKESFEKSFPRLEEFKSFIDPQFSSSFWRRVTK